MPYATHAVLGFVIFAALAGFLAVCARSPVARREEPHGDIPEIPPALRAALSPEIEEIWPVMTAEPEHSHRSALGGRRPGLGVFESGRLLGHSSPNSNDR